MDIGKWRWPIVMALAAWPAATLRLGLWSTSQPVETLLYGLAIVSAAFLLTWCAEAAERDVPRTLALAGLALIAVLPEYAVDVTFAWKAGKDPSYAAFATANMTGANRLLIGVGWAAVMGIFWYRTRQHVLRLDPVHRTEVGILAIATIYSFIIPLRGGITLFDAAFLVALFAAYVYLASQGELEEESAVVGPAEHIANLPAMQRRIVLVLLFLYAGGAILIAAEPFADGLITTGASLGVDEFLLVQWLAPLASEFPEFLVAGLLAWRLRADAAMGALVSSTVNQWTLLIGCLPIAFAISSQSINPLPTDARQVSEVLLTSSLGLMGLTLLINLRISLFEAAVLGALFVAQFATPHSIAPREVFSGVFLFAAAAFFANQIRGMRRYDRPDGTGLAEPSIDEAGSG